MEQNKVRTYLLYAAGEILLVVIGILIALQINTWYEDYKNAAKEVSYLTDLQLDLKADSVRLEKLTIDLGKAVHSKFVFEEYVGGNRETPDSLSLHFLNQYNIKTDFIPNSTTIDELKNSSGLNLIKNPQLRRQIVTLYNSYDDLIAKLKLGTEKSQIILRYTSEQLKDIMNPTHAEMEQLLKDRFFVNQTRANYLFTQSQAANNAYRHNLETLELIRKEL